ncbi:3211_t:CDS:1, partial [Cetraspora pellucida]
LYEFLQIIHVTETPGFSDLVSDSDFINFQSKTIISETKSLVERLIEVESN